MADPRNIKLADILVNYSTKVKAGDWVRINSGVTGLPLVKEVLRKVLEAGGHPEVRFQSDEITYLFMSQSSQEQLEWISPVGKKEVKKLDVAIHIRGPENTRTLTGVDPENQRILHNARKELIDIGRKRAAAGEYRWVITNYPCQAWAQEADMSLSEYEDFVYKGTYADTKDPLGEWQRIHDEQEVLVKWLEGKKNVVVRGPYCDLSLSIDGRKFINSDGTNNMPSGEIFTGPVEDSVNGWIKFSYPGIRYGREVSGVRLEFKDGKVVDATAEKNQDFLISMLDSDEGSRYIGEFAVGTNYGITKFTKSILYDEKIGGTIHMAVGSGYPETGSKNKSTLHWDFICDMKTDSEIVVDGELFYKDGQFQI